MKNLILTLDYELYGNGTGDVFKHMIEPTERLRNCIDEYGIKMTIFFEAVEYWRLKEEWEKGNFMGYTQNPVEAIEKQLRSLYISGHDIQLHIHPQWVDAKWKDKEWNVDFNAWRLSDFSVPDNSWTIESLLYKGKLAVENIIRPIDPNYSCKCLRAGGYNVQPSEEVVKAMRKIGLVIDSSIYPGGVESGCLSRYDYSNIPDDCGYWFCKENLENISDVETDIAEIPIVAFSIIRINKYLSLDRIKALLQNRKSAIDTFEAKTSTANKKSGLFDKISYFFAKESQTWDYCLFSKSMHRSYLKKINLQSKRNTFVLVGHPKSLISCDGLEYLIHITQKEYSFKTLAEAYKQIIYG